MTSRPFDFSQAAADWTTILPDLASLPAPGDVLTAGTITGTTVKTKFGAAGGTVSGVSSFNTRTGVVTLTSADVTTALTFTPYNSTNPANYQTVAAGDAAYVNVAGDTMAGPLTLAADPTTALQAATMNYVDFKVSTVASAGVTAINYNSKTGTTATDPGNGYVAWNTANQYDATQLYLSNKSAVPVTDWSLFWMGLGAGQKIVIELQSDHTKVARWLIAGSATNHGTWVSIPVTQYGTPSNFPLGGGLNVVVAVIGIGGDQFIPSDSVLTYAQLPPEVQQVPIAFPFSGKPASGALVNVPMVMALTIAANLTGSQAVAGTTPASNAVFILNRIHSGTTTGIGQISLTGSSVAFSGTGGSLAVGDVLQLVAPIPQDTALADVGVTILAARV